MISDFHELLNHHENKKDFTCCIFNIVYEIWSFTLSYKKQTFSSTSLIFGAPYIINQIHGEPLKRGPRSMSARSDRLVFHYNLIPPDVRGRCHSNMSECDVITCNTNAAIKVSRRYTCPLSTPLFWSHFIAELMWPSRLTEHCGCRDDSYEKMHSRLLEPLHYKVL